MHTLAEERIVKKTTQPIRSRYPHVRCEIIAVSEIGVKVLGFDGPASRNCPFRAGTDRPAQACSRVGRLGPSPTQSIGIPDRQPRVRRRRTAGYISKPARGKRIAESTAEGGNPVFLGLDECSCSERGNGET